MRVRHRCSEPIEVHIGAEPVTWVLTQQLWPSQTGVVGANSGPVERQILVRSACVRA